MMRGLLLVGLLGAAGCASELAEKNQRLERQIEEMRRITDNDRQSLRQLENRIFVLEDKIDTAEVARGKVAGLEPRLPVVTKHAPPAAAPAPAPAPAQDSPAPTSYDDGPPDDGPPIVIKMDGSSARTEAREARRWGDPRGRAERGAQRSGAQSIDLASVSERLPVVPLPKAGAPSPPTAEPLTVYQEARAALGRREHAAAIAGFKRFIERWPSHDYADNAQYWLGESYYDQADYQTALVEFRAVVQRYPNGNKAPDALLKVGYCLAKLGESAAASDVLAQVAQIYPKTDAARLAQKRLDEAARGQP